MKHTLFAGLIAAALVFTPAGAATHKRAKPHAAHAAAVTKTSSVEDQAWGGTAKHTSKKTPKKVASKKPSGLAPTVTLVHEDTVPPPVAIHPVEHPTVDPKATATAPDKSALDMEKTARRLAARDPKGALATYSKLITSDPNFAYAGDVYADMYRLSVRSGGDILDRLKYAGLAGQKLEAGMSQGPVDPTQVKQFQHIEEQLENQWIQTEMQKILSGKE